MPMNIPRIDMRKPESASELAALRAKLAIDGDVVSESGRRKTVEVFGEPLSPVQVVERICRDVRQRGFDAVCEYTRKLDDSEVSAAQFRVSEDELAAAHAAADPAFLDTVRRVRRNVWQFQ
ncbi:MAG: histidinol dehydrogenase, partial [Planctomycetota bacterium]